MKDPRSDSPSELIVIFRTHSDVEASIVRALLEAHGIRSMLSSDLPHSVFPLSSHGAGQVRILVHAQEAAEAARVIESHRTEAATGELVRLRDQVDPLERRIGYRFRDHGLLEHALTHTSHAHEDASGGVADNESLEFLGDAVVGFLVADLLFREFPESNEGQKSKIKAAVVSTQALARLASGLALGDHLLLGRGEEKTGGRRKQALLANTYEALIAAIYLDGGIAAAQAFVERQFAPLIGEVRRPDFFMRDYKSALQEYLQSRDLPLPNYRVAGESGPDHRKLFRVDVQVRGETVASASGRSKKEAEQEAAKIALERLWSQSAV